MGSGLVNHRDNTRPGISARHVDSLHTDCRLLKRLALPHRHVRFHLNLADIRTQNSIHLDTGSCTNMSLAFDPSYSSAIHYLRPGLAARPSPELHDISTRRSNLAATLRQAFDKLPERDHVLQKLLTFQSFDNVSLGILHIWDSSVRNQKPTAAIIHAHGGGLISGSPDLFSKPLVQAVARCGVPIFSVNYRKAPENPHPTPTADVYAALIFVQEHAAQLNIDPGRIAIMGESAGGGIAAGVALMARDRALFPPLAKQILIYPMLDDRNLVADPKLVPFAFWSYESNVTGWTALLGPESVGADMGVSPYAAPARAESLTGLPRTYVDVGELDIFRDEDISYVSRLVQAGVPVEFHLYPGVPHAFDWLAPDICISQTAFALRARAMADF